MFNRCHDLERSTDAELIAELQRRKHADYESTIVDLTITTMGSTEYNLRVERVGVRKEIQTFVDEATRYGVKYVVRPST